MKCVQRGKRSKRCSFGGKAMTSSRIKMQAILVHFDGNSTWWGQRTETQNPCSTKSWRKIVVEVLPETERKEDNWFGISVWRNSFIIGGLIEWYIYVSIYVVYLYVHYIYNICIHLCHHNLPEVDLGSGCNTLHTDWLKRREYWWIEARVLDRSWQSLLLRKRKVRRMVSILQVSLNTIQEVLLFSDSTKNKTIYGSNIPWYQIKKMESRG